MITQKITAHDIIQVLAWDELKTVSELIRYVIHKKLPQ